jgi:quaternary ammonium compound-resistance protein SugE
MVKGYTTAWLYLMIAGLLEVGWTIGLKYTFGFTKLVPSAITIITMLFSFFFLSLAIKSIPVGTGYAIWTGIGTAILGIILFSESTALARMACIGLIVIGIIGLKLTSGQ